ncbi:MAG TPA: enoyl-CoA hydratase/isomerase family protein [Acidimicrobiia bacterium]|nr:enoyl-CoA hydratase/isomerase family protein [Acidimicrobiia bacterium]
MAEFETLLVEVDDGVATVMLNRPDRLNAFDVALTTELYGLWRSFRRDDEVRAIVLTGAGDRAFCTGIDRADEIPQPTGPWMMDDPGLLLGPKSADLWKPVVAAVNGMACGGAFYMLGEVETIVAAEHATFFDPHVTYGMTAAFEPMLMSARTPFGEIMRLTLLGNYERMSAQRALQVGLVQEVVPGDELLGRARQVAREIAEGPPIVVQGTVRSIWLATELARSQAVSLAHAMVGLGNDPDLIGEGQDRFASGQRVEWRLR